MEILSSHSCCVQNWVVGEITAPFSGTLFLSQWCFMENCHCLHRLFSNIPQSKALSFPASSLCKNWVYLDLLLSTQDWPFRYNWSQLKYPYALFTPLYFIPLQSSMVFLVFEVLPCVCHRRRWVISKKNKWHYEVLTLVQTLYQTFYIFFILSSSGDICPKVLALEYNSIGLNSSSTTYYLWDFGSST